MDCIMNLNTSQLQISLNSKSIPVENHNLIAKLILTSIRHFCTSVLENSQDKNISETASTYMRELKDFRNTVVQFNPKLDDEIQSLILSILLLHFPNGLNGVQSCEIDNLMNLNRDTYDAFNFCGLSSHLRSIKYVKNASKQLKNLWKFLRNQHLMQLLISYPY